jgi:Arc/MetJ-type ribon-helix-helix transcriptional regulator
MIEEGLIPNKGGGPYGFKNVDAISITVLLSQLRILDKLVSAKIYGNRSQIIRLALDQFLNSEYRKALQYGEKKIIKKIKKRVRGRKDSPSATRKEGSQG